MSESGSYADEINTLVMNIETFIGLLSGLIEQLRNMSIEEVAERLSNLVNALREQKESLSRLGAKLAEFESEMRAKAEAIENERTQFEARIRELEEKVKALESERGELRKNLDEKERILEELKTKKEELESKVAELSNKVSELESALEEQTRRYEELSRKYEEEVTTKNQIIREKEELESKVAELSNKVSELEVAKADLESKINELNVALEQKDRELSEKTKKVDELTTKLSQVETELAKAKELISKYERDVAAVPIARALIVTHPEAHVLRVLPVFFNIGTEEGEYICVDGTKFTMRTKRPTQALISALERTFDKSWYTITSGIPPKICIKKTVLEALRILVEE